MRSFAITGLRALAQPFAAAARHALIEVPAKARSFLSIALLFLALAAAPMQADAGGTGPHRWFLGGNTGACGSAALLVENNFATLAEGIAAINQAWAAFPGCGLTVGPIEGSFPSFVGVGLDASGNGVTPVFRT